MADAVTLPFTVTDTIDVDELFNDKDYLKTFDVYLEQESDERIDWMLQELHLMLSHLYTSQEIDLKYIKELDNLYRSDIQVINQYKKNRK